MSQPPRYLLYRILGNDLPPRHGPGEMLANLRFILAHEPLLESCEKRWVLNRIADPEVEAQCLALLAAAGHACIRIQFVVEAYARQFLDGCDMPAMPGLQTDAVLRHWALEWRYRYKALYVAGVNFARNRALDEGRMQARWTLPWDGACFVTNAAWRAFTDLADTHPEALQLVVPLARIADNRQLLDADFLPQTYTEPQLAFRNDSGERFDETLRYGNRNKGELLRILGVAGGWHQWRSAPWDPRIDRLSDERDRHAQGAWVARLASTADPAIEADELQRWKSRFAGVRGLCDRLDREVVESRRAAAPLPCYPLSAIERVSAAQAGELIRRAQAALQAPLPTILDKTAPAPEGDRRNYFSIAPHYHASADGSVQHRDGERNAQSDLQSAAARAYDRVALEQFVQGCCASALAGTLTGERVYFEYAVSLLRTWLVDAPTRMNPHLRHAQTIPGDAAGQPSGIVEFRNLWCLIDAIGLCRRAGRLAEDELQNMQHWFALLLDDLSVRRVEQQRNNIGTWADLVIAASAAFVGDSERVARTLARAPLRLVSQLASASAPPLELRRAQPLHYGLFNLQAWICLAWFGRAYGVDLWRYQGSLQRSVAANARYLALNRAALSDYATAPEVYDARIAAAFACIPADAAGYGDPAPPLAAEAPAIYDDVAIGMPPLWPAFGPAALI